MRYGVQVVIMGWRSRVNPLLPIGHRRGVVVGVEEDYYGLEVIIMGWRPRVNPLLPIAQGKGGGGAMQHR